MQDNPVSIEELRELVGSCVVHQGEPWQVVEFLEDTHTLILVNSCENLIVQADQFGEGHRRVREHIEIPVISADGTALHPDFLALDPYSKR